jgi:hypothetical protein
MNKLALVVALSATSLLACVMPKLPWSSTSNTKSSESRTVATSETHMVNGHPVDKHGNREDADDDEDDDDTPHRKHKASRKPAHGSADFGETCRHNDDCESNTCYVGSGDVGYCTKICDDFGDCPMSWECTHKGVGNAPQKICQQEKE